MKTNKTVRITLVTLIALSGLYLVVDHGQHLAPYLPFTFLFGCLFMHLFMHGGHNHGSNNKGNNQ